MRINLALKPRVALEVLRGAHGTRKVFYALAEASSIAGAFCALGVERDAAEVIRMGSQACAEAYREGGNTGVWKIGGAGCDALVRLLDVYDLQLEQVNRLQVEAALRAVTGRQETRATETGSLKRAA